MGKICCLDVRGDGEANITTFRITTLSVITLSIMDYFMTLS